jgi:hypothetical protein
MSEYVIGFPVECFGFKFTANHINYASMLLSILEIVMCYYRRDVFHERCLSLAKETYFLYNRQDVYCLHWC